MAKMKNDGPYGKNPMRGLCSLQYNDVQDSESFKAMRSLAQLLFMKSKRFYRRDLQTAIGMSARIAAELVGCSPNMGSSLCKEIVHHGFWRKHRAGHLGSFGKGIATAYQLTDEMFMGEPATLDFLKWDGTPYHEQKPPSHYSQNRRDHAKARASKFSTPSAKRPESPPPTAPKIQNPVSAP